MARKFLLQLLPWPVGIYWVRDLFHPAIVRVGSYRRSQGRVIRGLLIAKGPVVLFLGYGSGRPLTEREREEERRVGIR